MAVEVVRAAPGWSAVAAEQFRRAGLALRVVGPGIVVGLFLIGAWGLYRYHSAGEAFDWRLISFLLVVFSAVIPPRAWFQNEVVRRSYMWSLPVERGRSHLSVVASGWLWLILVVSAFLAWWVTMYRLTGGTIPAGGVTAVWSLPPPTSLLNCAVLYTSATIIYLITSVPLILTRRPISWIIGGWLGSVLILPFLLMPGSPIAGFLLEEVLGGRVGLFTALSGQAAWTLSVAVPDAGVWLTAAGFWVAIALGAVLCAAVIHREA